MSDFAGELKVLGLTEKGIKCSVVGDNAESFWLPRGGGHVVWRQEPEQARPSP